MSFFYTNVDLDKSKSMMIIFYISHIYDWCKMWYSISVLYIIDVKNTMDVGSNVWNYLEKKWYILILWGRKIC